MTDEQALIVFKDDALQQHTDDLNIEAEEQNKKLTEVNKENAIRLFYANNNGRLFKCALIAASCHDSALLREKVSRISSSRRFNPSFG